MYPFISLSAAARQELKQQQQQPQSQPTASTSGCPAFSRTTVPYLSLKNLHGSQLRSGEPAGAPAQQQPAPQAAAAAAAAPEAHLNPPQPVAGSGSAGVPKAQPRNNGRGGAAQRNARREAAEAQATTSAGGKEDLAAEPGEFEQDAPTQPSSKRYMRGRLKEKAVFWASFCRNPKVLEWIMTGFILLWAVQAPAPICLKNHGSASEHSAFVSEAVRELVYTGTAIAVTQQPHCVLPLGIVVRPESGKKRLILESPKQC
jgi:hypothetical protein